MSRCLAERSIDHVVLERGEVANSWKTERWDSLRLLTPNWQSRLPGYGYEGDDPDGYRTMPETIAFIECYADVISAPVQTPHGGERRCTPAMAATSLPPTGATGTARTAGARHRGVQHSQRSRHVARGAAADYRHADTGCSTATRISSREGGVMVVGASATGTQIAAELHRLGPARDAVGGRAHPRTPSSTGAGTSSGGWMPAGVLDERYDEVDDINRARSVPSLQLAGSPGAPLR